MQEKMLKLLKLLAEDDNFALVFDEAQSIEEKFNLAKSKCKSLQKDGFVKFLLEFQAEQLEVNEKELDPVEILSNHVYHYSKEDDLVYM